MTDWIVAVFIVLGSGFTLVAAVGVLRMPDVYLRLQAATKAATLGVSFVVLAAAIQLPTLGSSTRSLLIIAFIMLTAPVAAHLIARAAYSAGVPMWEHSHFDELREADAAVHRGGRIEPRAPDDL